MSIIGTIEDADISQDDLLLLSNRNWLNDRIIYFSFKLYERSLINNSLYQSVTSLLSSNISYSTSSSLSLPTKLFKYFDPILVSFLSSEYFDEDDFDQISKDSSIISSLWWFLPITNKEKMMDSSSHWSLLIYNSSLNIFFHLDSMNSYNQTSAKSFSQTLAKFLKIPRSKFNFIPLNCPQQPNGYDCGVFVILFTYLSSQYFLQNSFDLSTLNQFVLNWQDYLKNNIKNTSANEERIRLRDEIQSFISNNNN